MHFMAISCSKLNTNVFYRSYLNALDHFKICVDISEDGVKRSPIQMDKAKDKISAIVVKSMLKVRLTNDSTHITCSLGNNRDICIT